MSRQEVYQSLSVSLDDRVAQTKLEAPSRLVAMFSKLLCLPAAIFGLEISCTRAGTYICNNPVCVFLSVIIPSLFKSV